MKGHVVLGIIFGISQLVLSQEKIEKDSITTLEEVIVLENKITKHTEGITPSDLVGGTIFQNYSPVDVVSAINQIPGYTFYLEP